jgi:methionine biosynthesis protein MetW
LKGDRFLDVGCGDGDITLFLKENMSAKEAFGIEIADEAVVSSRSKGINAFKVDIDQENLPFNDNFFDVAYCGEVIEHVFDTDHLLEEIFRVLKPNGKLVITTPNLAGWPSRFALLFGYQPFPTAVSPKYESVGKLMIHSPQGQGGHIRVLTLRAFKELVAIHGYKINKIVGCPVVVKASGTTGKIVQTIDRVMAKFPSFASRVILVVEKGKGA